MLGLYYYDGSSPRTSCRGVLHLLCALSSPFWAAMLLRSCHSRRAYFGSLAFAASWSYVFVISAAFHTYPWQVRVHHDTEINVAILWN